MKYGILLGNGLDFYRDLEIIKKLGFDTIYIHGNLEDKKNKIDYSKNLGFTTIIVDINGGFEHAIECIDKLDADYYYIDEPYTMNIYSHDELTQICKYISEKRPDSKFVIGELRIIQEKKYKPIENAYYVYTSYTNNWYIPIIDKAIPIGQPNQSPAIKRIHKKMNSRVPWIWAYGQNKLLCHPDEYHKLYETAEKLNIPMMILYLGDGIPGTRYELNYVPDSLLFHNICNFILNEKPYTTKQWWKRFFHRIKLSLKKLYETKNLKYFIETLF